MAPRLHFLSYDTARGLHHAGTGFAHFYGARRQHADRAVDRVGRGHLAKACTATVSNARPTQRSTVVVAVSKVAAGAVVTTTAHYKTTISTKTASANSRGAAALPYLISRATHGFRVVIGVTAAKGSARWVCSTSFTTR